MKTNIISLEDKLNDSGFNAKIWKGFRIYLNGFGRDIKAYFEFDEPESQDYESLLDGTALKVYTNANQSYKWKINRSRKVKFQIMNQLKQFGIISEICEDVSEVL